MTDALTSTSLSQIDLAIIVAFFCAVAWVGSYFRKWINKPDDFYLAGRQLTPFILAATLAATNCSLYNFQSYVGYAYREGISIVWHEWTGLMAMVFAGVGQEHRPNRPAAKISSGCLGPPYATDDAKLLPHGKI